MTRQQQYFSSVPLATLQQNLARNAFMAHPENVVLAMLGREDGEARSEAVTLIMDRSPAPQAGICEEAQVPRVKFDASTYIEMADVAKVTSNPFT